MKKIFSILFASFYVFQGFGQFEHFSARQKEELKQTQTMITRDLNRIRIEGVINLLCPLTFSEVIYIYDIYIEYQQYRIGAIYTETHRKRILEVLNNEWPEWELEAITQKWLQGGISYEKHDAKKIAEKDSSRTEEAIFDSLVNERYQVLRNQYKNETKWHKTYAKLASFINDPHFVEPIKKAYSEDTVFYGYCLARMGIEPYLSKEEAKLIAKMKEDNSEYFFGRERIILGLRTQAVLKQLSEYLLSNYTYKFLSEGDDKHPYFTDVATELFSILANEEIRDLYTPDERESFYFPDVAGNKKFTKEHAKRLYDWMQENYGNYKIRPF